MGSGFWMNCPKCKERYSFSFGAGFLTFTKNIERVVYYCPKCGNWENKEIKTGPTPEESLKALEDYLEKGVPLPKKKRHFEICQKCKSRMKNMKDIDIDNLPILVCKKCNEKLKYDMAYCWD